MGPPCPSGLEDAMTNLGSRSAGRPTATRTTRRSGWTVSC